MLKIINKGEKFKWWSWINHQVLIELAILKVTMLILKVSLSRVSCFINL